MRKGEITVKKREDWKDAEIEMLKDENERLKEALVHASSVDDYPEVMLDARRMLKWLSLIEKEILEASKILSKERSLYLLSRLRDYIICEAEKGGKE